MHSLTSRRIHTWRRDFSIVMPSMSLRGTRIVSFKRKRVWRPRFSLSLRGSSDAFFVSNRRFFIKLWWGISQTERSEAFPASILCFFIKLQTLTGFFLREIEYQIFLHQTPMFLFPQGNMKIRQWSQICFHNSNCFPLDTCQLLRL